VPSNSVEFDHSRRRVLVEILHWLIITDDNPVMIGL